MGSTMPKSPVSNAWGARGAMTAWRCAREKIRRKRAEITLVSVSPAATAVATPATAAAFATGMSMVGHLPLVCSSGAPSVRDR